MINKDRLNLIPSYLNHVVREAQGEIEEALCLSFQSLNYCSVFLCASLTPWFICQVVLIVLLKRNRQFWKSMFNKQSSKKGSCSIAAFMRRTRGLPQASKSRQTANIGNEKSPA
jgi:hypothetical protein